MPELQKLKFPEYRFRFRTYEQSKQIFDPIRKKFVDLTPEEWVRQHLLLFLSDELGYPLSMISVERGMKLHKMNKRTDMIVYDRSGKPWMLVECKAPNVKIDQKTIDQIGRYNIVHKAPYLFISNGTKHYLLQLENGSYKTIADPPIYNEI